MKRYKNHAGNSNVVCYDISQGAIVVVFDDGQKYRYTDAKSGSRHVFAMIRLATKGSGLNSYIAENHVEHADRF